MAKIMAGEIIIIAFMAMVIISWRKIINNIVM
jgi:hypothetical protein